jgi:hypothetical protein
MAVARPAIPPPMTTVVRVPVMTASFRRWARARRGTRPTCDPSRSPDGDLFDEAFDERRLGLQHREPALLLDQEQRGHALSQRVVDDGAGLDALLSEPVEPPAQQRDDLARGQSRDQ